MTFITQNAGLLKSARSWALLGVALIALVTLLKTTSTATLGVSQQLFKLEVDVVSPSPTAQIAVIPFPGFGPIPCPPSNANNYWLPTKRNDRKQLCIDDEHL